MNVNKICIQTEPSIMIVFIRPLEAALDHCVTTAVPSQLLPRRTRLEKETLGVD